MNNKILKGVLAFIVFIGVSIFLLMVTTKIHVFLSTKEVLTGVFIPIDYCLNSLQNSPEHQKVYFCFELIVGVLLLYFVFTNARPYHSGQKKIMKDIEIPTVAGQGQHGTASFMEKNQIKKAYDHCVLDKNKALITALLKEGKKDIYDMAKKNENGRNLLETKMLSEAKKLPFEKSGIVLGKERISSKKERLITLNRDVHSLIIGATRCGKTRCLVVQTICTLALAGEGMIINDPKGELFAYCQPFLARLGYDTPAIDFKNPRKSIHYNFLQPIVVAVKKDDLPLAIEKTWDMTKSLVGEAEGEKIWTNGEASIIAACIMIVVLENMDHPEFQNITNVYFFIAEMCKTIPDKNELPLADYMKDLKKRDPNHPALGLVAISEIAPFRTRGSFFTQALTTLQLFTNPLIAGMTANSEIDLDQLSEKRTALFIILPDFKTTYYPIATLLVSQIYESLALIADSCGGRLKRRMNYMLDEFGNFVVISDFVAKLTVGGGRGMRFFLFLQSLAQLEDNKKYGKELTRVIIGNCDQWVYLKTNDKETLKEISERLGNYTVSTYSVSASLQRYREGTSSSSVNLTGRALLMADEVKKIERPYSLVMGDGKPAIMKAPDLSQWFYNEMLGLGDEKFNTTLRERRDAMRKEQKIDKIVLWKIWEGYQLSDEQINLLKEENNLEQFRSDPLYRERVIHAFGW